MKARFNGKCVECGQEIKTGKEIVKNSNEKWVHKACSDLEEKLPWSENNSNNQYSKFVKKVIVFIYRLYHF